MADGRIVMTPKANKPTRRKERGQAMVEFALLLPLFLIVIFIAVDFGVGLSRYIVLTNATREGARMGVTGASANDITNKTIDTSNDLLNPVDITVNYPTGAGGTVGEKGDSVVVDVTYTYDLITPLKVFLTLGFNDLSFGSCTDMRLEQTVAGAADDGVTTC